MRSIVVSLALAVALVGCDKKKDEPAAASADKPAASAVASAAAPLEIKGKRVDIKAGEDGFAPKEINVKKGEETTLVFTRTTEDTCATEVDFPDLKVKKDLPLNKPVAINIPAGEAKTYGFQCGMGMYKSKVIVAE